uniref:Uncharacterized protein n=1 Tax=Rhizophora mucronata TaxID=61149 RepID=A0A2P2Q158_RHIMU
MILFIKVIEIDKTYPGSSR